MKDNKVIELLKKEIDVDRTVNWLRDNRQEINRYQAIMQNVNVIDVAKNEEFQRNFNYFYKIRRDSEWREKYYSLFQQCKNEKDLSFRHVLRELAAATGCIEKSFSSKLLATLNPDKPIWDSIVLNKLGLSDPVGGDKETRIKESIQLYSGIEEYFEGIKNSDWGKSVVTAFDKAFPDCSSISTTKKIDFMIWSHPDQNNVNTVKI